MIGFVLRVSAAIQRLISDRSVQVKASWVLIYLAAGAIVGAVFTYFILTCTA